ncbi:unnamed protein product [Didymodactylos carnosus]|uniref:SecA family profile domain-containing protein n=1 Tax=Didymodactylos carnosus TaxID=1234261 RepID=A0A815DNS5_9BILA|nr:unnamed protein product [Didymodactylos carnosus]CAF4122920.1 unnamed protein product [Didymodactylos carnosus]
MSIWIQSAFHVRDMTPNDTYIVSRDKLSPKSDVQITVMDKDTGIEQASTRWSNGVHQFLQLKHMRRITPESLKAVFISNMSFFKRCRNHIIGLTGSLGSFDEQLLLDKVYQLRFFELPRSAVLIICENVKNVLILKEYLANTYPNAKDYKSAYEDFHIDQLHPGDTLISTNLADRDTDLETSKKLEEKGGLHVITTYLPTNIRIEMQAFGRIARKGNHGTGEYIIQNQYDLSIETLKQLRNHQEKQRLDSFLMNDLSKVNIEEDLLQGFHHENLSCLGFIKLYQKIEKQLSDDLNLVYYGYQYIRFLLNSLKNRWAFWLDSMSESINMINMIGKKKIIEKFNEFQLTIENDLKANHFRKLVLEPNQTYQLTNFENFRKDKIDQIINFICENLLEKLKNRILAPALKHVANHFVSRGVEHFLGADRIEQISNTFELIHAAANPLTKKTQYADALTIFLADALIDMKQIYMDPKNVYPENGDGRSLQQMYHLYGDKVKTYVDKNGKIYVRRPISREYYRSIRGDKAAGPHEQQKIDAILGCVVTKNESINNEQICTLSRPNGSAITFLIRDNGDGIKHAELLIDGESITMDNKSQNKNDCYYNVVLVANEISQGKSFEDAMKIFDNESVVKNLRENVSLAIKMMKHC